MSRIEEALAKLHAQGKLARAAPSPSLARVTDHVSEPAAQAGSYGGKRIEIDFSALRLQRLLAPDSYRQHLTDEYRVIKRPLLRNADRTRVPVVERGNLLMVASATPGEGKTFTCINLGLSVASERDWRVVLVDGDCRRPHLTELFGAQHEAGLVDLLRDPEPSFEELVMPTNVDGLAFLPAGRQDAHAAELFASARMEALCESVSNADPRRLIIFDSSPLLFTTEAAVLASQVGQVAVVVKAETTPRRAVVAALGRLDSVKAVNLILNQASTPLGAYGTYGAYGYSRDAESDSPSAGI